MSSIRAHSFTLLLLNLFPQQQDLEIKARFSRHLMAASLISVCLIVMEQSQRLLVLLEFEMHFPISSFWQSSRESLFDLINALKEGLGSKLVNSLLHLVDFRLFISESFLNFENGKYWPIKASSGFSVFNFFSDSAKDVLRDSNLEE